MNALFREASLLLRSRTALGAFLLLTLLASVSVAIGLREVAGQEAAIERMIALQAEDSRAVRQHAGEDESARP
jgi:hypothetical protein